MLAGKIVMVDEMGFYVEVKSGGSIWSLATSLSRGPARGMVLTSSDDGGAEKGLSSNISIQLRIPPHSSRQADLRTASLGIHMSWAPRKTPGVPRAVKSHFQEKVMSVFYSGSSEQ